MNKLEEAWATADHAMRWSGRWASVRGVHGLTKEMLTVLDKEKSAVRAALLVAHVEACGDCVEVGELPSDARGHAASVYTYCGDRWYCDKAKAIQELGK